MNSGTDFKGYTIIEVMIFLAVSGLMFVVAAIFVSGKQAHSEFVQSINDINSQVEQVIDNVGNGYYPSANNVQCTAGASGGLTINGSTQAKGTNIGCIYLGQVIQFGAGSSSVDPADYNIFTVAGRQFNSGTDNSVIATNFTQAQPQVIDSLTESNQLSWGMAVTTMKDSSLGNINAVGFFSSLGSYSGSGTLASGNVTVGVVPFKGSSSGSTPGESESNMSGDINSALNAPSAAPDPQPDILVCFTNNNGLYASLTIGDGKDTGQQLTTDTQIYTSLASAQAVGCN